jgi:hypothetical protein
VGTCNGSVVFALALETQLINQSIIHVFNFNVIHFCWQGWMLGGGLLKLNAFAALGVIVIKVSRVL